MLTFDVSESCLWPRAFFSSWRPQTGETKTQEEEEGHAKGDHQTWQCWGKPNVFLYRLSKRGTVFSPQKALSFRFGSNYLNIENGWMLQYMKESCDLQRPMFLSLEVKATSQIVEIVCFSRSTVSFEAPHILRFAFTFDDFVLKVFSPPWLPCPANWKWRP